VLLLDGFDETGDVDEELAVEMRAAGAVPSEQVMSRSGGGFGSRSRGHVRHRDVVDGDGNLVLLAPVLCELVEPFVIGRNEVTPLHDRKGLGVGQGFRDEWCGYQRRAAGGGNGKSGLLQEPASGDMWKFGRTHPRSLLGLMPMRRGGSRSEDGLFHRIVLVIVVQSP